ncbi:MAG: hypothetical protein ACRD21_05570 [Vicinamibacteria bacterium]
MLVLQIHRDVLRPGSDAAYREIEEEIARDCRELWCPHPYLGAESLTGRKEVWYFNEFRSMAEQKQVGEEYARNHRLTDALRRHGERKARHTLEAINAFASYRKDLSRGAPWSPGQGRFLSITVTGSERVPEGTVFETADGTKFIVVPAETEPKNAEAETRAFAVRPYWSMPAKEWIAADPAFWPP